MPRRRQTPGTQDVGDYRHEQSRRRNNPPAGLAPTYEVRERQTTPYAYDPHLDPQLVWAGKAEHTSFEVDVVSLHIHERVSTKAILDAVRRPEPVQGSLFGETALPADQQVEFYQHDVDWANRLILGDSLLVMNSLLVKEGMAGKVQMIYVDPPYGISYSSNFQPQTDRRNVRDRDDDLTHEPEQIKAYRDTWKLGIHSYLTYLRDRLLLARELLADSGSVFVQINDDNLHLVRALMDEVFGSANRVSLIAFAKTSGFSGRYLSSIADYLLWYARDATQLDYWPLFRDKKPGQAGGTKYKPLSAIGSIPDGLFDPGRLGRLDQLTSQGDVSTPQEFSFHSKLWWPKPGLHWKTQPALMPRLSEANRIAIEGNSLSYVRFLDDYPVFSISNMWADIGGIQSRTEGKLYAVQTSARAIERCLLMTTKPGHLVFDLTCGSGTTAYCAEKWGRRWITCDTSHVALAIARKRLMVSTYDYYELADSTRGPSGGFVYRVVPHIKLEDIAKNAEIDDIAARFRPQLDAALQDLNGSLGAEWEDWEVPYGIPTDAEPPWPAGALEAHARFWTLKRRKQAEIDESIQRNAPLETLYDRPKVRRGTVRVSGPFTVEAIPLPAVEDPSASPIPQFEDAETIGPVDDRAGAYISDMVRLLQEQGGVLFPGGKRLALENLRLLNVGWLHAEGETRQNGDALRVAVSFGPQHGPLTAFQVQEAVPTARMNGYAILIFAGFAFDPETQALIQRSPVAGLQVHFAHIAPDVLVGDLLKTNRASQIFAVFGQPDVAVTPQKGKNTYTVELRGVDIYDPLTGETQHAGGGEVAAWFLDSDYDGMTCHICQAFFPGDGRAWQRLQLALKARIDRATFRKMRGTISFPFEPGQHQRIAVKVIDFRGNEVIRVVKLGAVSYD